MWRFIQQQYQRWVDSLRNAIPSAFGASRLRNILILAAVLMAPLLLMRVSSPTYAIPLDDYFTGAVFLAGFTLVLSTVGSLCFRSLSSFFDCIFVLSLDGLTICFVLFIVTR